MGEKIIIWPEKGVNSEITDNKDERILAAYCPNELGQEKYTDDYTTDEAKMSVNQIACKVFASENNKGTCSRICTGNLQPGFINQATNCANTINHAIQEKKLRYT